MFMWVGRETGSKRQVDFYNGRVVAKVETNIWERNFGVKK